MGRLTIGVIIPAYNEAPTVGQVVEVARRVRLVDELVVVDDGSEDGTAEVAAAHGARVVAAEHRGKGETLLAGARAIDADILVLLDADLTGLRPEHVDRLARAVAEEDAVMALGLFDRGPWLNWVFLRLLPRLTGERALRRELLLSLEPADVRGYRIEAALNSCVAERRGVVRAFVLDGMFHRTKEEKESFALVGFARKMAMLSVAGWEYVAYRLRRLG
ncbi:MAG: glycosyl transferase family 2 [Dactylosporangium sp.]|jgi:glycosyltransferase involved in cell wall biosynthesis|nr:glycosyl transferase family 2 [Dactylosporangium sp.]